MEVVVGNRDRLRSAKEKQVPVMRSVAIRGVVIPAIKIVPRDRDIRRRPKAAGNHLAPDVMKAVMIDPDPVRSRNRNRIAREDNAGINVTDGQVADNDVAHTIQSQSLAPNCSV